MPDHIVWRLTGADADGAAIVLARGFHDEPVFVWALREPNERMRMLETHFVANLRHACRYGEALAVGVEPGEMLGVVYWVLKPDPELSPAESADLGFDAVGARWGQVLEPIGRLEGRAIAAFATLESHWHYLAAIAVDPKHQGKGFGSILVARVVAESFAAGSVCGLATDRERNVPFYARHGFEVVAETESDGVRLWSMLAKPAAYARLQR